MEVLAQVLVQREGDDATSTQALAGLEMELWLTPLILLPGVALLIVSTSARFGQLHQQFHDLLDHPTGHDRILGREMLKRGKLLRDALGALYSAVGLFAVGSLLGGLVHLWHPQLLWVTGVLTLVGIACVAFAAVQLIRDATLCLGVIRRNSELLQSMSAEQQNTSYRP